MIHSMRIDAIRAAMSAKDHTMAPTLILTKPSGKVIKSADGGLRRIMCEVPLQPPACSIRRTAAES